MYTSVILFVVLLLALEFSFSTLFKKNPLYFMLMFKAVWMVMEIGLLRALTEKMIALPFECALQTAQYVMTLGADGFINFITANMLETGIMMLKRIAIDPIKYRLIRVVKLRLKVQAAQRSGTAVPISTPEIEAIGLMTDMLSLMYRFSVDTLGAVIAPITIAVLYLFAAEFEVAKLYAMRASDLRFFMMFSFFILPALWVVDILLFNLEELLWTWKLFEYIQFCHERFKNRSRRWIGLDTTINEELPPDLRAMDQMCLSIQFFMLGALHASGIVMAVLGYMLVLHKSHNIFGDITVIPIFLMMSLAFNFGKKLVFRLADRVQLWMVEGEKEYEEVYDEGPGSRLQGALPPGMAAVDATLAECIEDAFAVGYTDDTLAKLLQEATLYIPPGTAIQAAGTDDRTHSNAIATQPSGEHLTSHGSMLQLQAEGTVASASLGFDPSLASGMMMGGCLSGGPTPVGTWPQHTSWLPQTTGPFANMACIKPMGASTFAPLVRSETTLPVGVPPPPGVCSATYETHEDGLAFKDFMDAFRVEMRKAKDKESRTGRFIPSSHLEKQQQQRIEEQANAIFGVGPMNEFDPLEASDDSEDYDYWPDELVPAGIAVDEPQIGSTSTTASTTESSTASTDVSEETEDGADDYWPVELLVG